MAKAINAILNLKDKFSKPIQNATKQTKEMERRTKQLNNSIKKMGSSLKNATVNAVKWGAVGAVAVGTKFLKDSVDAYKESLEQETKLQAVLMNTKGMTLEKIEAIKAYTGELQKVGVVEDDVITAGTQQLGTYQLQAETLKQLMPGMADLIAQTKGYNATAGDAVSVGNMLGKVMAGQTGALTRAGIIFSKAEEEVLKFGTEQEKATTLAKVLQANVGGVNKALAETDYGKIIQAKNAFGDMQEEVGARVMPILGKVATFVVEKLPVIEAFAYKTFDVVGKLYNTISPQFANLKQTLSIVAGFILSTIEKLKQWSPVLIPLISAIAIYNGVLLTAKAITTAVTFAQTLFNAVLMASPFIMVIGLISGLVAWLIHLYNTNENVRNVINNFWNALKKLFPPLEKLEQIGRKVVDTFGWIAEKVQGALSWIKDWNNTDVQSKDFDVNVNGNYNTSSSPKVNKNIPRHALGTRYFQGGITSISEGGRSETAILPSGTKILSHNASERLGNNNNRAVVNVTIQGNVIGNRQYMEEVGQYVGNKVILALDNM
ncbi:hypothetical protein HMPREF9630_00211 [Peptoanaerobacter stomatis]|uniref:Uncharacterized protein n=1 Tax=Peptoanaerobacter stomatis TaxID=796937 RepID=V9HLL3_9FIRM|nr:hypothetical protein [Peptoanaerobacter stomatis]EHL18486.1 hypothetical protein HMPREF9630_00211 [Peptoanaerobacter stomatis]